MQDVHTLSDPTHGLRPDIGCAIEGCRPVLPTMEPIRPGAKPGTRPGWSDQPLARRPTNVVLVAMANKTARVAWVLLRYERIYQPTPA